MVVAIIIIAAFAIFLLSGFRKIQQQERGIVEFFGKFSRILKPGLNWILPGMQKIRAIVPTWELPIPLFTKPIKIDFQDGSAVPKDVEVFVKMKSPDTPYSVEGDEERSGAFRAVYEISNWRTAVKDLVENAVRTYLNRLTVDEAITMQKAGFDLVNRSPDTGLPNEELDKIEEAMARWGIKLIRITAGDFDLEEELVKARGQVHVRERHAEAAEHAKVQRARETMGSLIQMIAEATGMPFSEVQAQIKGNDTFRQEMKEFAEQLVTRRMSIDGKALTDIRTAGGGSLEKILLRLIAAKETANRGSGKGKEEDEE